MFERELEEIKRYDKIVIHRHTNPDGDALGSQIGLAELLKANFPNKKIYAVGDMNRRFAFMEGSNMDELTDEVYKNALAFVLDTSAKSLISDTRYENAKSTIRIDHHIFVEKICDIEVTDTSYESCCGLIAELAIECGFKLTPLAAKSLYTGMVTDSGRFRYDSTNSNTHRLASFLMSVPFGTDDIYRNLYTDDFEFIRLRAKYVLKIQLAKEFGVDTFTLSRGMVNTMGDIRGVDSWVNFTETDEGVLCEIRSAKYNINPIAVKHGGGGHAKASGATLKSRQEAMELVAELEALAN